MFLVLAPLVSGCLEETQTWMFCLNVMAFVSKQISVRNAQMEIRSHMGQGTGQDGFEMLTSLFFSSFVILRREEGPKRPNLLEFR